MAESYNEDESSYVAQDQLLVVDSIDKWKELTCIEYPGEYNIIIVLLNDDEMMPAFVTRPKCSRCH